MVKVTVIGEEEFLSIGSDAVVMIPIWKIKEISYRELSVGSWVIIETEDDKHEWEDNDPEIKELIAYLKES